MTVFYLFVCDWRATLTFDCDWCSQADAHFDWACDPPMCVLVLLVIPRSWQQINNSLKSNLPVQSSAISSGTSFS